MANITRFDPFTNLMNFDPFWNADDFFRFPRMRTWMRDLPAEPEIKMDVSEDDKAYHVKAEVPGVKKEDIHVAVDGNVISISAEVKKEKEEKKGESVLRTERYYGMQSRSFTLMHDVDESMAEAKCSNGILELTLPKKNGLVAKELRVQ
ncbi:MAG TPA: Hsp20/alpha crystallin family protein [Casimicrobiaceae bacterium]|nr:Hsp20/alpha crystallin family protein [Casimicrobiaceae bacterium]